jgi:hypothetical protein
MAKISDDVKKQILSISSARKIKKALEHNDKVPLLVLLDSILNTINLDIVKKRRKFQETKEALSKLKEKAGNLYKLRRKL